MQGWIEELPSFHKTLSSSVNGFQALGSPDSARLLKDKALPASQLWPYFANHYFLSQHCNLKALSLSFQVKFICSIDKIYKMFPCLGAAYSNSLIKGWWEKIWRSFFFFFFPSHFPLLDCNMPHQLVPYRDSYSQEASFVTYGGVNPLAINNLISL